ncbi:MAG: energy transducer TonB [Acidobacteriota bacterium]|nr:energy transducer TonB [Acidobacteriota bacterium]
MAMRKLTALLLTLVSCAGLAAAAPRPAGASTSSGPVIVDEDVMRKQLVNLVAPVYPPAAKSQGITGTVVLNVVIDQSGNVTSDTVASGSDPLASAAVSAVSNWTYKPYLVNGAPVAVQTTVTVIFDLGK